MYVDSATVHRNGTSYPRRLLRECDREQGKIKHRTVANLSAGSPEEIETIRLALRHTHELTSLSSARVAVQREQGAACGAVLTLLALAKELGVVRALGSTRQGKLALWHVIARAIDQGSQLSAVRLAATHGATDARVDCLSEEIETDVPRGKRG